MIPLIRGILLFWEMIKEHNVSKGSWFKMRMPGAKAAASFKIGSLFAKATLILL